MAEHEHAGRLNLEPIIEQVDVLEATVRGTFEIRILQSFRKLIKEVQRLQSITDHLCPVYVDGKFSHFVDDREPTHRAKFEKVRARVQERHGEVFKKLGDL